MSSQPSSEPESPLQLLHTDAEAAAYASQAALQSFYDSAPFLMGIGELDGDKTLLVSANVKTAEFLGVQRTAMPASTPSPGTPQEIEALWLEKVRKSQREGVPVRFEYRHPRGADAPWLDVTVAVMRPGASGRPQYSFIAEEITARKEAEARAEAAQLLALTALEDAQAELETRVVERTKELEEVSHTRLVLLQRLVTVQEDERQRVARELHDTLGQFVSALNLRLTLLQQNAALNPTIREEIEQMQPLVRQVDRELDRLTLELRPPALDELGLLAAVRRYAQEWTRTTGTPVDVIAVGFDSEDPARFPAAVESAMFRIMQEALTNVLKHAEAAGVNILLERRRSMLCMAIEDNGVGFDPQAAAHKRAGRRRLGLVGMQERASLAGGTVEIESAPGAGTTVFVRVPLAR